MTLSTFPSDPSLQSDTLSSPEEEVFHLEVESRQKAQRLDAFLSTELDLSRSRIKKALLSGACLVDGKVCTEASRKVERGMDIEFFMPRQENTLIPEEGELEIVYRDEYLVVVNKPPHLTVHPCPSCPEGTLVHRLLARVPELAKLEGLRPGIVHRLDKDTSGLMVVALTEEARLKLTEAFASREVAKTYLAITRGLPPAEGESRQPLGRHPSLKTRMAVVPESKGGKKAHSEWKSLYRDPAGRFALLAVRIHTGRTHQIRVHLCDQGHPLWGDAVYGPSATPEEQAIAPRQMLHAWNLRFTHPITGEAMNFICPPPDDFTVCMTALSRRMIRLALTGVAGCGKSSLLKAIAADGIPTWSADAAVAGLYAPQADGWRMLRGLYGDRFIASDDAPVNKPALAAALASEPALRREIEAAIHPMVFHALQEFYAQADGEGRTLAVAEVPLWHESRRAVAADPEFKELLQEVWSVTVRCPNTARCNRLEDNRGWSAERTATVDSWQLSQEDKARASDFIVENDADEAALHERGRDLLRRAEAREADRIAALQARWHKAWSKTEQGGESL